MKSLRTSRLLMTAALLLALPIISGVALAQSVGVGVGVDNRDATIRRCKDYSNDWVVINRDYERSRVEAQAALDLADRQLDGARTRLLQAQYQNLSRAEVLDINRQVEAALNNVRDARARLDRIRRDEVTIRHDLEIYDNWSRYNCTSYGLTLGTYYGTETAVVSGTGVGIGTGIGVGTGGTTATGITVTANPVTPSVTVTTGTGPVVTSGPTAPTSTEMALITGTWYRNRDHRSLCTITLGSGSEPLVIANEYGQASRGYLESSYVIVATTWPGGLRKGIISADRRTIDWGNGVVWTRQSDEIR